MKDKIRKFLFKRNIVFYTSSVFYLIETKLN